LNTELIAKAVILETMAATDKVGLLGEAMAAAAQAKLVAKKSVPPLLERLLAREKLGSTGIGNGVAIPHVKDESLAGMALVVGRSVGGVDYDAIDGRPVHTLFLLLAAAAEREAHLAALRWISGLARNTDFRRFFLAAKSAAEIRELLQEMSAPR
jgi:mannitol/fructose-specific phosphotransferase system IIA component (Ntr-type)